MLTTMRMPLSNRPTQIGFSLIELMVVMAIVALTLHSLIPALASQLKYRQQWHAVHLLYKHLSHARLSAIHQRTPVTICPSESGQSCDPHNQWHHGWMVFVDAEHRGQPATPNDIIQIGGGLEQSTISSAGRHRIRFQPTGTAYGSNGTLLVCNNDAQGLSSSIVISNPGRIRWQQGSAQLCDGL